MFLYDHLCQILLLIPSFCCNAKSANNNSTAHAPKLFRKQIPEEKCGLQFVLHMMCAELGRSGCLCLLTSASNGSASQACSSLQFLSLLHQFGAVLVSVSLFYSLRLVPLSPDVWALDNQPESFFRKWWVFRKVQRDEVALEQNKQHSGLTSLLLVVSISYFHFKSMFCCKINSLCLS